MAKSKTEKVVDRMTERLQNSRNPMTLIEKVLYWGLLLLLVLSAIFLPSILKQYTGLSILSLIPIVIFSVCFFAVVVVRKNKLKKKFWKVPAEDAATKIDYTNISVADTSSKILEFYDSHTLVFGSKKEALMPFVYNWFLTSGYISDNEKLEVYTLQLSNIRNILEEKKDVKKPLPQDLELLLINIDNLDLDENQLNKLGIEESIVRPFRFPFWVDSYFVPNAQMEAINAANAEDDEDEYDEESGESEEETESDSDSASESESESESESADEE